MPPVRQPTSNVAAHLRMYLGLVWRNPAYSLAILTCGGVGYTPPETCEAMKNAATTAGRLISLRN